MAHGLTAFEGRLSDNRRSKIEKCSRISGLDRGRVPGRLARIERGDGVKCHSLSVPREIRDGVLESN
jgi:hypothetical protein